MTPSTLTRALRALADCLGLSTGRRSAPAATKAVPPSTRRSRRAQAARSSKVARATGVRARVASFFEPLEERALMSTTYYVSPSGNDSNKGNSTSAAWKSISKVNSTTFAPGDQVLFQGGQTFSGSMTFFNDGGSASDPFVVGSYGSGKATISSGTANGLWALNVTGISIQNLNFAGKLGNTSNQDGIRLETMTSNYKRPGYTVNNCSISGYASSGICFGGDSGSAGLTGVNITNNTIYNNEMAGIQSYSVQTNANTNVYIAGNSVHDNFGNGSATVSGSGIMLQGLDNATIEKNVAYNNGAKGNGAVGIWAYDSTDVTFQYNAAYNNHASANDGDGFDFDSNVSNSTMQYNYSYDNDGSGYMLCQWKDDSTMTGNTIRYNVSVNDGRRNNYAGVDVYGKNANSDIYNNTIYDTKASSGSNSGLRVSNSGYASLHVSNVHFADNVVVTTGGAPLVSVSSTALNGSSNLTFTGNDYYSSGSATKFTYGSSSYASLAAWQAATGQEKVSGKAVGSTANPMLVSAGQTMTPSSASSLTSLTGYKLQASSTIIGGGVNAASLYGVSYPSTDYYGTKIASASTPGADSSHASKITGTTTTTTTTTTTAKGTVGSTTTGADIGSPKAGSDTISGTTTSVTAGGTDIWGTSDSFRYVYKTLSGNGQIIAKVASEAEANVWSKAGVMIRNGTAANAAEVSMILTPTKIASVQTRTAAGATTTSVKNLSDGGDQWVKLVRNGNTFSGYISANGTTWSLVSTSTVSMSTNVTIGLAVTSHDNTKTEAATFQNVAITGI